MGPNYGKNNKLKINMEDYFETKEEFIEDNLRSNIPFSKQYGARTYIDIEILPNLF